MERIKKILNKIEVDADFKNSKNFIEDGLLDSLDIMTLVEALEDTFDIEVKGIDIVPENFVNVGTMVALVKKYGGTI
jgi:acyl carrier protein